MKCQYIKPLKKLGLLNVSVSDASALTVPVALLTNAIEISFNNSTYPIKCHILPTNVGKGVTIDPFLSRELKFLWSYVIVTFCFSFTSLSFLLD